MENLRYRISIETNEDSTPIASKATKKEALRLARYYRTGGLVYRNLFEAAENPNVSVYDAKKEIEVYCKPLFKYALGKQGNKPVRKFISKSMRCGG